MWTNFATIGRRYLHLGVRPGMNPRQARTVAMTNLFALVGALALTAGVIHTALIHLPDLSIAIASFLGLFLVGMVFNMLGYHRPAVFYLLTVVNCGVFYFDSFSGGKGGVYLYYFPLTLMIAFIFDYGQLIDLFFYVLVTFSFVAGGIVTKHELFLSPSITAAQQQNMFGFNLFNTITIVTVCTFLIIRMNYAQHLEFQRRMEERQKAEEQIRLALREKETLLAEVHHRVKNNLAVVSSLLNLQMNLVTNEYTKGVLLDSKNRVASMALIHQKLYRSSNFSDINFSNYAAELVEEIKNSYPENTAQIEVDLRVEERVALDLVSAIPCGLILNELLSNSYKHAFRDRRSGAIDIRFHVAPDENYFLDIRDNGCGLPEGFDIDASPSLGMTLIQSLCGQLDAQFMLGNAPEGGTMFTMRFRPQEKKTS